MVDVAEHPALHFALYPPIGDDDWRYGFSTAVVRVLESQLLSRAALSDMATSESFEAALDMLSSSEYAVPRGSKNFSDLESILLDRRTEVRNLFKELMIDEDLVEPLLVREDFANMRLALRRKLTEKPLGVDYSNDGSVSAEAFEAVFEEENYSPLPYHMQDAIEQAVLAYYQKKDIRQIDHALDRVYYEYKIRRAQQLKNVFILELFRMQIDLTNIRTMLRLKLTDSQERNVFIDGGYVEKDKLRHGLDVGYEAVAAIFFATPYYNVVESGVSYLPSNNSFLQLEANCEYHISSFLKTANLITAGPQPVIAYLLLKEIEIRNIRLILTGKMNSLDARLILDRIGD
jgi:V/A-type H+-transporting ATPase subunit C